MALGESSMNKEKKISKAVALRYTRGTNDVPRVIASGKGHLADQIIKVASENAIPVYKDPSLVEMLSHLDLQSEIPPELYSMVAEVLVFIYSQDKEAGKRHKTMS